MANPRKKRGRAPLAAAPVPRTPRTPPRGRVPPPRNGAPLEYTPSKPHLAPAPVQRPLGQVPSPRTPKLVRDEGGGPLMDLFDVFRDLPRPPRPLLAARAAAATLQLRRK
jgi:hypothetical protein